MCVEVELTELKGQELLSVALDMRAVVARLRVAKAGATHAADRSLQKLRAEVGLKKSREVELHHCPEEGVPFALLIEDFIVQIDRVSYFAERYKKGSWLILLNLRL